MTTDQKTNGSGSEPKNWLGLSPQKDKPATEGRDTAQTAKTTPSGAADSLAAPSADNRSRAKRKAVLIGVFSVLLVAALAAGAWHVLLRPGPPTSEGNGGGSPPAVSEQNQSPPQPAPDTAGPSATTDNGQTAEQPPAVSEQNQSPSQEQQAQDTVSAPATTTDQSQAAEQPPTGSGEAANVPATGRQPLLMAGKKTLFQKVLTRPGACLYKEPLPAGNAPSGEQGNSGRQLSPFTIFYVFDRKNLVGKDWVEVATATREPTDGWIEAQYLIDWKQTITVAFTNPVNRERTLFFQEKGYLRDLLGADDLAARSETLYGTIQGSAIPDNFPVISIEPATHIDITKNFYLLPILEAEETYLASGFNVRMLKIASVTPKQGDQDLLSDAGKREGLAQEAPAREPAMTKFRAGIVFVIDSTISMGPYIDRTREAVRRVYNTLNEADLLGKVSFGLVAYRDNLNKVPRLEYVSRIFGNLNDGERPEVLLEKINAVQQATVSSFQFIEDAYAGLASAIEEMDWSKYGGRYIILITDSGARRGHDPLSKTRMNEEQIRQLALDKGIAIYCMHLLTDAGKENHDSAASQYRTLAEYPGVGSLYYPVAGGAVQEFGKATDMLAHTVVTQVKEASHGQVAAEPSRQETKAPSSGAADSAGGPSSAGPNTVEELREKTQLVGRAMQLAYLGAQKGTQAPSVFEAWAADRDFLAPATPSLSVHVLLTKNQLSDLQQTLKRILTAGKESMTSSKSFFDQLQSAAATMSRTPEQAGRKDAARLGDRGLLGEYLSGLPYQSKVMSVNEEIWMSWSVGEQQAFLDEIEAKIQLYEKYHDDVDRWVALDPERPAGDSVYPVPLDCLP